jgi:16S rRNA processing protein RimM
VTKRILLGHIAGAHGIRGEVLVKSYTDDPAAIAAYGPLSDKACRRTVEIESVRVTGKGVIARVKGIADRTAAEALKGMALTVARDALPPVADGDFYLADLIGLAAVDPDGKRLGSVVAVQNFGAGNLLEIRLDDARQTEFVPFDDTHVPAVDIAAGRATIVVPVMVGEPEPQDGKEEPDGHA